MVSALTTVTKRSPTPPFVWGQDPKGVLAVPGTPRNPKSNFFVTNWDAEARIDAEFGCGSRQIGPNPSISTFVGSLWPKDDRKCQASHFLQGVRKRFEHRSNQGWKKHPLGPVLIPKTHFLGGFRKRLEHRSNQGWKNIPWRPWGCLLYTSPSPRDGLLSRMPSSA